MKPTATLILMFALLFPVLGQQQSERQQFIRVEAPAIALKNVRVIDGTGAAAVEIKRSSSSTARSSL